MSIAPVSGAGSSPVAAQGVSNNQPDPQLRAMRQAAAVPDQPEVAKAGAGAEPAEV
jgi:hypothetical protein